MRAVSFTGTRWGLSPEQIVGLSKLLVNLAYEGYDTFVHGRCAGADVQAATMAKQLGYRTEAWPSNTAWDQPDHVDTIVNPPGPPLERNKVIVMNGEFLIACPRAIRGSYTEVQRSGTWATIRYARSLHRRVVLV